MGILWRRTHPHPSHWNQIQFYLPWVVLKQISRNIPYMDAKRQAVHKRVGNTVPLNPNQTIFIVAPKFLQPACHAKSFFLMGFGARIRRRCNSQQQRLQKLGILDVSTNKEVLTALYSTLPRYEVNSWCTGSTLFVLSQTSKSYIVKHVEHIHGKCAWYLTRSLEVMKCTHENSPFKWTNGKFKILKS